MTKKIICFLLILVFAICSVIIVNANPETNLVNESTVVYDEAELLSESEEAVLLSKLQEISKKYNAQISIVTLSSMEGADIDRFVEYLYDEAELGYGENKDGVLLLLSMDPREFRILSNGFAASAITLSDIESITDYITPDLSEGYYADAFNAFADECEYYLNGYINGFPFEFGTNLLIALVVGLIAAFIGTLILKGQLKSVRRQNEANVYVKPGSMQITQAGDFFMYRTITTTVRQQNNSSSGSGSSRNVGGGKF